MDKGPPYIIPGCDPDEGPRTNFWLFCPVCGWQTEEPNTACSAKCPSCKTYKVYFISGTDEEFEKLEDLVFYKKLTVKEILETLRRKEK